MASVKLEFSSTLTASDPHCSPVVFVGLAQHLADLKYADVQTKFASRVSHEVFACATASVRTSSEPCPLYLNRATMMVLPSKCSRHNTPSRGHAITKCLRSFAASTTSGFVVLVCERSEAFASGCAVARAFPTYSRKTDAGSEERTTASTVRVEFLLVGQAALPLTDVECRMMDTAAESIRTVARIVDTPCNEMHTDAFLEEIRAVATELGIQPMIVRDKELERRGFGGIYGVGKAAVHPPALAVLSHTPQGATRTIAWVGKGIVYDTGGLSIKGKTAMPGMKRDCGGAAGVLGAFRLAVSSGFSQNLHAVFCLAENAVGPLATRPDDIHTLYSGRTVEINNTDAEGRLVLGDGVAYAQKDLKADIILDMATLTGAQGIAVGKHHAGILSNDETWESALVTAGRASGDLTFPMPFCPEFHFSEFTSAVADMKNSVADRSNATSSCAGVFILAHLGFDFGGAWMHVDMASPAESGERATGYGVALLAALFGHYTDVPLLQAVSPLAAVGATGDESASPKKKIRTD